MENKRKEEYIDILLVWMNNEVEKEGRTIGQMWFDLSENDFLLGENSINYDDLCVVIRTCISRKFLKYSSITQHLLQNIMLTEEGQARAISVINADSARVVKASTIHIETLNANAPTQIGNCNKQEIQQVFKLLVQKIDDSDASEEDKNEAKSRLEKFLAHPLTNTILGSGLGMAKSLLS